MSANHPERGRATPKGVLPAAQCATPSGPAREAVLAVLLSGVLLGLALPSRGIAALAIVALAPLLRLSHGSSVPRALGLGLATGVMAGLVGTGVPHTAAEAASVAPLVGAFAGLLGLVGAGAAAMRGWPVGWWPLGVACLGVALEAASFAASPVHLALCFWRWEPLVQVASITGVWGVSFLVWGVNAGIAATRARDAHPLGIPAILLVLALMWGHQMVPPHPQDERGVLVAAIQTTTSLPGIRGLDRNLQQRDVSLVVLPTFASVERGPGQAVPGAELARTVGAYVVSGYTERWRGERYRAAVVLSPGGRPLGRHRSTHLELRERGALRPGEHASAVRIAYTSVGMPVGTDICSGRVCRTMVSNGATLLLSPVSDPPSPGRSLHAFRAAFHPFRSAETGAATVRADPEWMSLVTDGYGRILRLADAPGPDSIVAQVEPEAHMTRYRRWGDWFAWACVGVALLFLIASPFREQARRAGTSP